jgi:hypothetical protein
MNRMNLLGAVFLGLGILALAYGGFTYTKDTERLEIGPVHLEVKDRETVRIPVWLGIGASVLGGILLANRRTRGDAS